MAKKYVVQGQNMGVHVKDKKGNDRVLLNPNGKGIKFSRELEHGYDTTNSGDIKLDQKGNYVCLSDTQLAWRSGYMQARQDSAKAYKSKQEKKATKPNNK